MPTNDRRVERGREDSAPVDRTSETGGVGFAATGGVGFAATAVERATTMVNVDIPGEPGTRQLLVAHFPRVRSAAIGLAIWAIVLVVPVLAVGDFGPLGPARNNTSGAPNWAISLIAFLISALIFGWIGILLVITAVRGGYVALTRTGVFVETGLKSVLIPWTAVEGASLNAGANGRDPSLDVHVRKNAKVRGWAWPAALSPVLLGSSGRKLHIRAWWFQPVPVDVLLDIVRYLTSHPEVRLRIGSANPEEWLNAAP